MKIKSFLLGLFLINLGFANAQEVYTTEYEVQYNMDYRIFGEDLENKQTEVLYLFTSPETSVFMNHNEAKKEEINQQIERMMKSGHIDMNKAGHKTTDFHTQVYKNLPEKEVLVKEEVADKEYVYQETQVPFDWHITSENSEYSGYTVQKATTSFAGRDYEAWFTMEIPIPDGPYVFAGLPGLIVELYDTEKHYHFTLLSIEKLESPKDWKLGKVKEVSKEKYREVRAKDLENRNKSNPFLNLDPDSKVEIRGADGREISQAEYIRNRKKIRESKNNPIELE